ncbi:unnamed protein product [Diamesa hyperborea]
MENIEFFDAFLSLRATCNIYQTLLQYILELDEDENPFSSESNESLSVLSMDHEAVEVVPLQDKITLANLHEALQFTTPLNSFEELAMQPGKSKSPSTQSRKSRQQKVYPNAVERRSSRIAKQNLKQDSNRTIYPTAKGSNKQIGKKTSSAAKKAKSKRARKVSSTTKTTKKAESPSTQSRKSRPQEVYPNAGERRSSRIAKQNLKQDSNRTIYPTAKGSNKQIGKKTA